MAELIEKVKRTRPGSAGRYDWDAWTDGSARRAVRGRDFACSVVAFKQQIYMQATKRGLSATVSVVDDKTVEFQFRRRDKPRKSRSTK